MNENIFEIEDIIPKDYQNYIEEVMTGFNFPWYFNRNLVSPDTDFLNRKDNHQGFNHFFFEEGKPSTHFDLLYPLVLSITSHNAVKANKLIRMRANLTLQNQDMSLTHHMPHIDSYYPHWVAIYYVNDSDGDTFIFNEKNINYDSGDFDIQKIKESNFSIKRRITPKKGKVVIFEGSHYHTSSWPNNSKFRTVININLQNVNIPHL